MTIKIYLGLFTGDKDRKIGDWKNDLINCFFKF